MERGLKFMRRRWLLGLLSERKDALEREVSYFQVGRVFYVPLGGHDTARPACSRPNAKRVPRGILCNSPKK